MTGKDVYSHGMHSNGSTSDIIDREGTLPTCLREEGYQTAAVGKMHFSPPRTRHGFDEMILPFDYYDAKRRSDHEQQPMRHGLGQNEHYPTKATVPEDETLTAWIAEQCVRYIRDRRDPLHPFFLWCSFSKPHPPLDPPEPYYSMYREYPIPEPVESHWSDPEQLPAAIEKFNELWSGFPIEDAQTIRDVRAAYYGLITQIDYNVGRILGGLSEAGELENTLIIYTSDHGDFLGDHGMGGKGFFHEPSAHVPFVLRPPTTRNHDLAGTTTDTLTLLSDILPTVVTASGGSPPTDCTGRDLLSIAREEETPREYVEGMTQGMNSYAAITDGRYKYIWYPEGGTEQLFDLREDPRETHNLATDPAYDERREEWHTTLQKRHARRDTTFISDGELISYPRGDEPPVDALGGDSDPETVLWEGLRTGYSRDADVLH